jgi:hypothetical protein
MPTPFMHLEMAERIVADRLASAAVRRQVRDAFVAFYFGSVAPDFQTISMIPRAATHFYDLPPDEAEMAYPRMMAQYPQLAVSWRLPMAQAVFVAAYCAHLFMDLVWYREVLLPYFLRGDRWQGHWQRFLVHNTLLAYLDQQAASGLPAGAAGILARCEPLGWLPFAADDDLLRWRDFLVGQLRPGARPLTAEIYAERMSITPDRFLANMQDDEWMQEHLFDRIPMASILSVLDAALDQSGELIDGYLGRGGTAIDD